MENSEDKITEISPKKARKPYTKRPVQEISAAIPVTQAPNPTILALEAKIFELSEQRSQAQFNVSRANQQVQIAQNNLRGAQEVFSQIDAEIQYKMGLIGQLRGGAPAPTQFAPGNIPVRVDPTMPPGGFRFEYPQQSPNYNPGPAYPPYPGAVSSFPANNHGLYPDVMGNAEGAQVGDADAVRREEQMRRGY